MPQPGLLVRATDRVLDGLLDLYRRSLGWVLERWTMTLLVAAATLVATLALYIVVPKGFLPLQDTGLIEATTEAGQQVSFTEMQALQKQVAAIVQRDPEVQGVVSLVGVGQENVTPNAGHLAIILRPRDERTEDAATIVERLKRQVAPLPGVSVFFAQVQDIQIGTRASRTQYQYTLVDTDAGELADWSGRLLARLRQSPVLRDVASDLQDQGLQALVRVDRTAAGRLGVTMQAIDDTLYDAFGQRQVSTIYEQANQYRVILEADPRFQADPGMLARLYVPGSDGAQVPLGAVAAISRTTAPLAVSHDQQFPAVTISFDVAPGSSLGAAVAAVANAEQAIGMPAAVVGSYSGDAAEFATSLASTPWLILAAVVAIYIVLGVLYESLIHPLTILSTLPSAGVGALLALMLFGMDLSLVSLIGIILLMGIVKKNAIIMIDFAIEAERGGLSPREAIWRACLLRFRPITMTTMAALLGALPLAFAHGMGAELRQPLGITIVGGLLLSQVLTLYTTPVIYLAMESLKRLLKRQDRQEVLEVRPPRLRALVEGPAE